ncbi:MAG: flagellar M-ring protein FliF [Clostridiales bacterium]|jgi:flagellar M-ring protein FliF|nr:flagellar M-ring protein FliF [Clostridiales bacterium]
MPADLFKQIKEYWDKLSKKAKTYIIIGIPSILVISIVATVILNIKNYEVLYSGLSSTEQAQIVSRLGELGVDFDTKAGGIILVPGKKAAELKMQLSSEGYPKSTLTYDLFTSSSDFMTTDFDKRQYLIFQLQDRLQESIKTLSGVKNAIVTLSIADESSYVLETERVPSTASIIIDLEPSVDLTPRQIKGIENLIAKSVPGLTNDNVSIIDSEGNILNAGSGSSSGVSIEKVEMEKQAGEIFKNRIVELLEPLYGRNGISAAVHVSIDFSQKSSDQIDYTPVDTGTDNQDTEGEDDTDNNDSNDLVNQMRTQITNSGGEVKEIKASVIINKKDLSDQEKASINGIIANAIGVDEGNVIVTNMEFTAANDLIKKATDALKQKPSFLQRYMTYIIPSAAAVILIPIILIVILSLRRKKKYVGGIEYSEVSAHPGLQQNDEIPSIVLNETREQGLKRQIREFSKTNPDIVAQLIRTWLKEENDD